MSCTVWFTWEQSAIVVQQDMACADLCNVQDETSVKLLESQEQLDCRVVLAIQI